MTGFSSNAFASRYVKTPTHPRRVVLIMAFLLALPFGAAAVSPAHAASPAETFVNQNVQKGLAILADKSVTDDQRRAEFRKFLLSLTDIKRIALFTLGPARRTASEADINTFVDAFRDFAVAIYESRLSAYSGQTLKVTGSQKTPRGDTVVNALLADPNSSQQPLPVAFRVSESDGHMVVIDVNVLGVWLSIEERDQFSSFLGDHGNSVPALTAHLKELTNQIRHGGAVPGQPAQQE